MKADNSSVADADVIIIGTGMGGATLGYELARQGFRVTFCEKGGSLDSAEPAIVGMYPEETAPKVSADMLRRGGRYWESLVDETGSRAQEFVPVVGSGLGGSSALYGAVLERFFPIDFTPGEYRESFDGANLPDVWPVGYQDLARYYEQAESLYRVRGERDSMREAEALAPLLNYAPLSQANETLATLLKKNGLRPYRLPLAIEEVAGCQLCQGILCARQCKNDAYKICIRPAIEKYGAKLLRGCEAVNVIADSRRNIAAVEFRQGTSNIRLKATVYVLSAGAVHSPILLQRSGSEFWPMGIGNDHDLVGRNLMRHMLNLFLLKVPPNTLRGNVKELGLNDMYFRRGKKYGTVQSFGYLPPPTVLIMDVDNKVERSGNSVLKLMYPFVRSSLLKIIASMTTEKLILASIMEDYPHRDNRVFSTRDGDRESIVINYEVKDEAKRRDAEFRRFVKRAIEPINAKVLREAENNERLAHACGTCRFGEDPHASVLDKYNRVHGVDNLYVVDSSFFPTSGGTNPSLTIAANALRVGDYLTAWLKAGR